ncbi:MAG: hypothetical protein RQ966_17255 [Acetobacteraceae bacterium]|nr:hypothetical protein [Acetobacteraceae bacterium]
MMVPASGTQPTGATSYTALLGTTTPLSDVAIPENVPGPVVAVVATRLGILTADSWSGANVRGNGSNLLWISGTAAQVNAKLSTLSYVAEAAGSDDLSIMVLAADGALASAIHATVKTVAFTTASSASNDHVSVDYGTLMLDSRFLNGPSLDLREPAAGVNSASLVLVNSTVGPNSAITVHNDNAAAGTMPRLAIAGHVELDGKLSFDGSPAAVSLARGATLLNEGTITIGAHAAQFSGAGQFINDGLIAITGDGVPGALVRLDTSMGGTGLVSLANAAVVELGGSVGNGETVQFGPGANTLHLADPARFAAVIAGFSSGDKLVFDSVSITDAYCNRLAEGNAAVTLMSGNAVAATLQFSVPQAGTVFQLGDDGAGHATLSLTAASTGSSSSVAVYRFFDAANGTQLLTQDRAERDAIIASRPDLHFEGVGLHALASNEPDPNTTAVYRFFDVNNGTHFLTASAAERNALLATRTDLVFEASSTMFEHATAQAGDTPVYRFFDNSSGAHFFTADSGERASLLSARPDMTFEGVAFYAPKV